MINFQRFNGFIFLASSLSFFSTTGAAFELPGAGTHYRCETTAGGDDVLAGLRPTHPRLLATHEDFRRLKEIIKENETAKKWFADLLADAEKLLTQDPVKYEIPDGKRLLAVSRQAKRRVLLLGLIYRLSGEKKWADRLWRELDTVTKFKDWNPSHFLDTAEMTLAVAIGYDWLYDDWSDQQRTQLRQAIVNLGLKQAIPVDARHNWWWRAAHNWNQVCNGGMVVGVLAVAEDEPELASNLLAKSVKSLPRAMQHFAPDGGWGEGPGYWNYATEYNVFCLAAMQTALGHDFKLSQLPGFSKTGDFPRHFVGPTGLTFNYADAGANAKWRGAPQLFWLASTFGRQPWADFQNQSIQDHPTALDLLWGAEWLDQPPLAEHGPLDKKFEGVDVALLRGDWDDPNATFVAFKGGDNRVNHGHLDLGSFVLDAEGERWIEDQGKDNYNLPGYFGRQRWSYYRLRAEANNTLVINPDDQPDQNVNATAKITKFESTSDDAFGIIDLTKAYHADANRLRRGVMLKGRRDVLVQDEIELKQPGEVWWFVNTTAEIDIASSGREAILKKNGKTFFLKLVAPAKAKFEIVAAVPLPSSPNPSGQSDNRALKSPIKKIAIHLQDATLERITVLFSPASDAEIETSPIDGW